MDRLDTMNWRLIDDADIYWIDEMVPTPARDVLQSEPSEAVKNYLKKEQEQCLEKIAGQTNSSTRRLPACPCISPDLRTSGVLSSCIYDMIPYHTQTFVSPPSG